MLFIYSVSHGTKEYKITNMSTYCTQELMKYRGARIMASSAISAQEQNTKAPCDQTWPNISKISHDMRCLEPEWRDHHKLVSSN